MKRLIRSPRYRLARVIASALVWGLMLWVALSVFINLEAQNANSLF